MWKKVSHILIWSSWILLLGHDLTPHDHKQETTLLENHKGSWIEFVYQLFNHDMGDEHLEFYEDASSETADDVLDPGPTILPVISNVAFSFTPIWTQVEGILKIPDDLPSYTHLRGPPASN
ncbi:MAG: hypothetical protein AAFR66_03965 [Bacteroidota bacterium]